MSKIRKQEALDYHSGGKPGKIEVVPTKPYASQRDLSLAYSPGVAEPCLKIAENVEEAYKYTSKVMSSNMLKQDAQEGISAFIENRDPIWSDN